MLKLPVATSDSNNTHSLFPSCASFSISAAQQEGRHGCCSSCRFSEWSCATSFTVGPAHLYERKLQRKRISEEEVPTPVFLKFTFQVSEFTVRRRRKMSRWTNSRESLSWSVCPDSRHMNTLILCLQLAVIIDLCLCPCWERGKKDGRVVKGVDIKATIFFVIYPFKTVHSKIRAKRMQIANRFAKRGSFNLGWFNDWWWWWFTATQEIQDCLPVISKINGRFLCVEHFVIKHLFRFGAWTFLSINIVALHQTPPRPSGWE